MTTTIEYLTEQLNERDAEIEELTRAVDLLEQTLRGAKSNWTLHTRLSNEQTLPVPRLEIVFQPDEQEGWGRYDAIYRLVYRHEQDFIIGVPLGRTTVESMRDEPPITNDRIDEPRRDSAHIRRDSISLGLPAYVVLGDRVEVVEPRR